MKLFEKIKIKLKNEEIGQVWIKNFLLYEYRKKNNNNKKSFSLKILPKMDHSKQYSVINKDNRIFYLKISRMADSTFECLQHWINVIDILDAEFYIICDNINLTKEVLKNITFRNRNIKFIKSVKNKYLTKIVKMMATPIWEKAAYAHLTTFWHAQKNGYNSFWNIDADDTMFLIPPKILAKKMVEIENYANKFEIDNFSLDMHTSKSYNRLWSFGVTYTRNEKNYFKIFEKYNSLDWRNEECFKIDKQFNIDRYFTYLRNKNITNNKIFYFDNTYFIHFGHFFIRPDHFGIYYWANNCFELPMVEIFPNHPMRKMPIEKSNIKFGIGELTA